MKCGIVTVYNSENCGSFLQAYALSNALKETGREAVLIRQGFRGHSSTFPVHFKRALKTALRGKFAGVKRIIRQRKAFKYACETNLQIVDCSENIDCYILGSDVIWDVTVPYFRDNYSFFWGTQFKNAKVISYAAALGFAKEKDLEQAPFVRDALNHMTSISVRDIPSKELLQDHCDREISLVCDPTYLIDRELYDKIASPTDLNNFIFLYCYGNLSSADQAAIQAFAKTEKLKTVTFGNLNSWCDIQLAYDPLLFLSLYSKANYIITNTFHGTVFATIYEKRFAVIRNEKPKILDVLRMCEMSDKMTDKADDFSTILHSDFDYKTTRQNILQEREKSFRYLNEALGD